MDKLIEMLELPSEILSVISGHLTLLELEALLSTGSKLLITKLNSGGIDTLRAPRMLATGMIEKFNPFPLCGNSVCVGCFRGLLPSFRMVRTIIYDIHRHSTDWSLELLRTHFPSLNRLELAVNCSSGSLTSKMVHHQLIIGKSMPKLEHLALNMKSGASSPTNPAIQFLIGTLPRTLKSFSMRQSVSALNVLHLDRMLVEWPPCLEILDLEVTAPVWPLQLLPANDLDWKWLCELQKQPSIGHSLHLKSEQALKTPILELKHLLPPLLRSAQIFDPHSPMRRIVDERPNTNEAPRWSFPHTLETLTINSDPHFLAHWLPISLTRLDAWNSVIFWDEGCLPNLQTLRASSAPTVALPRIRSMELNQVISPVFSVPASNSLSKASLNEGSISNDASVSILPSLVILHIPFDYGLTLSTLVLPAIRLDLQRDDEHRALLMIPTLTSLKAASLVRPTRSSTPWSKKLDEQPLAGYEPALAHFPPNLTSLNLLRLHQLPRVLLPLLPECIQHIIVDQVLKVEAGALERRHFERLRALETLKILSTHPPSRFELVPSEPKIPPTEWVQELLDALPKSLRTLDLQWQISPLRASEMVFGGDNLVVVGDEENFIDPFPAPILPPSLTFPLPHLTELHLPHASMSLPHFLRLPSHLKVINVAGILVRSTFHLTLLPSIPTRLPLIDSSTIPVRISFGVLGQSEDSTALLEELRGFHSTRGLLHITVEPNSLTALDRVPFALLRSAQYEQAVTMLCARIIKRPEFAHLEHFLAHLKPGMLQFAFNTTMTYGFVIDEHRA